MTGPGDASGSQRNLLRPQASQSSFSTQYTEPEYLHDPALEEEIHRAEVLYEQNGPYRTDSMSTTTTISPSQPAKPLDAEESRPEAERGASCLSWMEALLPSFQAVSGRSKKSLKRSLKPTASSDERSAPRLRTSSRQRSPTEDSHTLASNASLSEPDVVKNATKITFSLPGPANPIIIAHHKEVQAAMDKRRIAWCTQLEIARGVSNGLWNWDSVSDEKLDRLYGLDHVQASKVLHKVITGQLSDKTVSLTDLSISREYEREQGAIMENKGRGLGLQGTWDGIENWYGGRIQQVARLVKVSVKGKPCQGVCKCKNTKCEYGIRLEKPESSRSFRLSRIFGSRRILIIRVPTEYTAQDQENVFSYLSRSIVLLGRIFRLVETKDGKAYYVEVNMDYERVAIHELGDSFRLPWDQVVDVHNSLEANSSQSVSKWATRWALLVSSTIPAVKFEIRNINYIDDQYATENPPIPTKSAKPEQIMTDGCAFMNKAALKKIADIMKLDYLPIAVQGRIAGAKGMWILHPSRAFHEIDQPPMIWIRNSQNKIKYRRPLDRSQLIFDLLRIAKMNSNGSLYMQTTMNLSHNGIPNEVFRRLMKQGLKAEVEPLYQWSDLPAVYEAVQGSGKVVGSRLSKIAGTEARAFGYVLEDNDDEIFDNQEGFEHRRSNNQIIDRYISSGCPQNLHESALEMLRAGFDPTKCVYLASKLSEIANLVVNRFVTKHHIAVPSAIEAMLVIDPLGVLKEDEIFFRFSGRNDRQDKANLIACDNVDRFRLEGPAILTRNPTRLASDAHLVRAVHNDRLLSYVDVIVCSVKGRRSIASYMGGGDYDGDRATLFVEPELIKYFKKSPLVEEPPNFLERNFEKQVETVPEFVTRISRLPGNKELELHKVLLRGLYDTKVGTYSKLHDLSVYMHGYDHETTQRLAYMFMTELDSAKSGLRVKKKVFLEDKEALPYGKPVFMLNPEELEKRKKVSDNLVSPPRDKDLGKFVLESLQEYATILEDYFAQRSGNQLKLARDSYKREYDECLLKPHEDARNIVGYLTSQGVVSARNDLQEMETHIESVFFDYSTGLGKINGSNSSKKEKGVARSIKVQETIEKYEQGPTGLSHYMTTSQISEVKASYAYKLTLLDSLKQKALATSFPFDMAHSVLCTLMAKSKGVYSSASGEFTALTTMSSSLRTRWTERRS